MPIGKENVLNLVNPWAWIVWTVFWSAVALLSTWRVLVLARRSTVTPGQALFISQLVALPGVIYGYSGVINSSWVPAVTYLGMMVVGFVLALMLIHHYPPYAGQLYLLGGIFGIGAFFMVSHLQTAYEIAHSGVHVVR